MIERCRIGDSPDSHALAFCSVDYWRFTLSDYLPAEHWMRNRETVRTICIYNIYNIGTQGSFQYKDIVLPIYTHYKDEIVSRSSYLYNGIPHTTGQERRTFLRSAHTENQELSLCPPCPHWWNHRLSWRQPAVLPVTTKLTLCQLLIFSVVLQPRLH